ncbi:MAG: O-antigen ligase family protein [Candidatus Erginobacter occultus]|nr:O-antigen ligase family protein [Candidatus Erginobacter occultus]
MTGNRQASVPPSRSARAARRPREGQPGIDPLNLAVILLALFLGLILSFAITTGWQLLAGLVLVLAALVVFCRQPVLGVYAFILVSLWQFTVLPKLTLAAAIGYLALFAYIYNLLLTGRVRYRRTGQEWPFLLLLAAIGISAAGAVNIPWLLRKTFTLVQLLILYLLIANLIDTRRRLAQLLWVVLLSNLITAVFSLYQYFRIPGFRAIGLGKDPNYTAAAIIMGIFFALPLLRRGKTAGGRGFVLVSLGLMGLAFLLTLSRGGFVALGLVGMYWLLQERRKGRALMIVLAALMVGAFFAPERYRERISTLQEYQTDPSLASRFQEARAALMMIRDYPFFGVGFENMPDNYARYVTPEVGKEVRAAHNLYLNLAADIGLIGFAVFTWIIVISWRSLRRAARSSPPGDWLGYAGRMISLGFIGYLAASLFVSNLMEKELWIILASGTVLGGIAVGRGDKADGNNGKGNVTSNSQQGIANEETPASAG